MTRLALKLALLLIILSVGLITLARALGERDPVPPVLIGFDWLGPRYDLIQLDVRTHQRYLARVESLGDISLSPDERWIFVSSADFANVNQVNSSDGMVFNWYDTLEISWSPHGHQLAATANAQDTYAVRLIDPAEDTVIQLASHDAPAALPTWMPDGRSILYLVNGDVETEVYQVDADGGEPALLAHFSGKVMRLLPAPDRSLVLAWVEHPYEIGGDLIVLDGGAGQRLNTPPILDVFWAPDSQRMIGRIRQNGEDNLYYIDPYTGLTRPVFRDTNVYQMHWSPDGQQIAILADMLDAWDLYVVDWDGNHLVLIASDFDPGSALIRWSPDSRLLIYTSGIMDNNVVRINEAACHLLPGGCPASDQRFVFGDHWGTVTDLRWQAVK